jgi:hypothetical protein
MTFAALARQTPHRITARHTASRPSVGAALRYNETFSGPVAQLAEQQTLNLRVGGSIPPRLTK